MHCGNSATGAEFSPIQFEGVLPSDLQGLIRQVEAEAIAYAGRQRDVQFLERYLAGGADDTARSMARQIVLFQRQFRQAQEAGLPGNLKNLVARIDKEAIEYKGRGTEVERVHMYIARGDHATAIYQANLILQQQSNLRSRAVKLAPAAEAEIK